METLPFFAERGDKQHTVSDPKVVLGQAGDGLVPGSPSELGQPWIIDVVDVDKGLNHAEQLARRDILVDQRGTKCLCE